MPDTSEQKEVSVGEAVKEVITVPNSRMRRLLSGRGAEWMLALISFTESAFLPIITDPFLVMMTLAKRERWLRYSIIVSAASVAGGIAGYFIGMLFFDFIGARLVALYSLEEEFARTASLFNSGVFWVTLFGAVTPIPYKIFALVGGLLQVAFLPFVLASVVGRTARYILVSYITYRFGEYALQMFSRRLSYLTILLVIIVVAYVIKQLM